MAAGALGCGPAATAPRIVPSPTSTSILELRVLSSKSILFPGDAAELVAEGRANPEATWAEARVLWDAYPEKLGILEVPPSQGEGMAHTFYTATAPGRVTIVAQHPASGDIKGRVTLEVAAPPAPSASPVVPGATAHPTPRPAIVAPPDRVPPSSTRAPLPTLTAAENPGLREAITRLDRLDRQVLAVADGYVPAFRTFGSKQITIEQLAEAVDVALPRMDAAAQELAAFSPPAELKPVHARYLAVAWRLRQGLGGFVEFCRTSDPRHAGSYVQLTADALVESAMAKADLDAIAASIGMAPPRSTRVPAPTRTP